MSKEVRLVDGVNVPALMESLKRGLVEAKTFAEVKDIRDKAKALQVYLRSRDAAREVVNEAGEWRLKAERRLGEEMAKIERNKGGGEKGVGRAGAKNAVPHRVQHSRPKLVDLGVTRKQASRWQQIAAIPQPVFDEYVKTADEVSVAGALKVGQTERKQEARAHREQSLAESIKAAQKELGSRLYGVIYADPPWRFEPYSRETGMDRAADNHYPTMELKDIADLDVPAADDCVLFLWATAPMLAEALNVMAEWRFEYVSHFAWVKNKPGTGYWTINQHELLLIGVRGKVPAPAPGQRFPSVVEAPRGRHSEKPDKFAEMIETMFPNTPKIELFARRRRLGWDVWGAEA